MERKRSVRRQRRYRRPWLKKCKEYIRTFIAFLFSNVGIIGLVVGYTIAGAFIFTSIEKGHLVQVQVDAKNNRDLFIERLWNLSMDVNNKVYDEKGYINVMMNELEEFQKNVVNYTRRGYDGTDDLDGSLTWSFAGAFLYSLTVITTIGYGNIFPHTPEGKIATIVYAITGMPLFLLYLSNIGDIMARSFKWVYANCCLCRWCPGVAKRRAERRMRRAREDIEEGDSNSSNSNSNSSSQQNINLEARGSIISDGLTEITQESYDVQAVTVPVTICLMIIVGYICAGAILFCKWESWSFMDASYFCFISLSTIGFGDLVPGDKIYGRGKDNYTDILELSFVFCSMYLMIGMALIAMCFNLMQEEVIHKIRSTVRTIKYILRCNR